MKPTRKVMESVLHKYKHNTRMRHVPTLLHCLSPQISETTAIQDTTLQAVKHNLQQQHNKIHWTDNI